MHVSVTPDKDIEIDDDIVEFIKQQGMDYRVSTTCSGAMILPTSYKPPKPSDLRVDVNGHRLFISRVQAQYINKIDKSMLTKLDYSKLEKYLI
jgi:hypothetical protein